MCSGGIDISSLILDMVKLNGNSRRLCNLKDMR